MFPYRRPVRAPGAGDSHIKATGVIVRNFERNPQKVPEGCFVGVVRTIFAP